MMSPVTKSRFCAFAEAKLNCCLTFPMKYTALLLSFLFASVLPGADEPNFLEQFNADGAEDAALAALWDEGVRPAPEEQSWLVSAAVYRESTELLRRFLAAGYPIGDGVMSALEVASERRPAWKPMLEMLLAAGAEVDAYEPGPYTPLWWAASELPRTAMETAVEMLLAHGADASFSNNGIAAADFIVRDTALADRLRAKGYALPVEPATLNPEEPLDEQETTIKRMALIHADAAPYAEALEKALLDGAFKECGAEALVLLQRADPARASRTANCLLEENPDMVVWAAEWEPTLKLDSERILSLSRKETGIAYPLCSLLWCCEDADAVIDSLLDDAEPAVQAGAWKAKLRRAGLPVVEVGEVAEWLAKRGLKAEEMSPAVQLALSVTSWDRYCDGEMSTEEKLDFLHAYRKLGLDSAYACLSQKEMMDAFFEEETWYPSVMTISRFIWEHREEFSGE